MKENLLLTFDVLKKANSNKLFFAHEGEKLKKKILQELKISMEDNILILDLKGVEIIDASFAREAFIKLIKELSLNKERPQILFTNLNEYVFENMDISFCHHNMFTLVATSSNEIKLLGKFSSQLTETVNKLKSLKKTTSKELAQELEKIELTTLNNRLKNLHDMCVIKRKAQGQESGGKEYLYYLYT